MTSRAAAPSVVLSTLLLAACGGSPPPTAPAPAPSASVAPAPSTPAPAASASAAPAAPARARAHALVVTVGACWFGGVWSDAEGADTPETRAAASEARCHDAARRVWGTDDKEKYEQLRALDPNAVEDVGNKVRDLAKDDAADAPRKDALGKLVSSLAAAKKEEMLARRAGERVKRDIKGEPEKLTKDEVDAVGPLKQTSALDALYKLDAGDLTPDAEALALMSAMDRMAIVRGLPKHLKVYGMSGPVKMLFGVEAPAMPEDATKPLKPGAWLAYLLTAAKGAGHPVPDTAKTPLEKEPAAWAGVLEGLHDKLMPLTEKLSDETQLKAVVTRVARTLEHEYNAERNVLRKDAGSGAGTATTPTSGPSATPKRAPPAPKK